MKHHFKWDKKYLYWGITASCVVACAILFFMALRYIPAIGNVLSSIIKVLSPFIWGLVITYLLAPMTRTFEKNMFGPLSAWLFRKNKKKDGKKLSRGLSVFLSEIILLDIITLLVYLIIPQLYKSIETIVQNSNVYIGTVTEWAEKRLYEYPEIEEYVMETVDSFGGNLVGWLSSSVLPGLGNVVTSVAGGVVIVFKGIYNLLIGIVVSVYLLCSLESLSAKSKRLLYCIFTVEVSDKILKGTDFVDKTFTSYITGTLLDAAIIGLLCYIFCVLTQMPYALLISVIVGVTNVIPFFGPFIGAIPSALIILLQSPIKCLVFVIFIIVLQQCDGNIIKPKILSSSVGINGFWVLFSIIVGAGLFGFWGMLIGVPVFVVIQSFVNRLIVRKLKRSGLPTEVDEYKDIDNIDPVTYEVVKKAVEPKTKKQKKRRKSKDSDQE